ncbi:MAG: ribosome recycling factor [Alphaproteobacteria bacterium]|nr:ribosome recycling factor [Alphaproteobacteria bacterium]
MSADESDLKRRMDGALEALKRDFAGLRTGRASTSLLENIQVDAYGSAMPLNQVASVSVPEPRLLTVQVWDNGNIKATEKAIMDAELGLNPQTEGNLIRVPIPELSEERREEMTKVAAKYAEQGRIAVRNVRRDGMDTLKKMEKDNEISQDEQRDRGEDIQKMTDAHVKIVDELLEAKEQEIMQV